jgi:hypothetical protein
VQSVTLDDFNFQLRQQGAAGKAEEHGDLKDFIDVFHCYSLTTYQ